MTKTKAIKTRNDILNIAKNLDKKYSTYFFLAKEMMELPFGSRFEIFRDRIFVRFPKCSFYTFDNHEIAATSISIDVKNKNIEDLICMIIRFLDIE